MTTPPPRRPFGHSTSNYRYDFYSLMSHADASPLHDQSVQQALSWLHEFVHWAQHLGTTSGACFSLMKFHTESIALEALLHALSDAERGELLHHRRSSGAPIVPLDAAHNLARHIATGPTKFDWYRSLWHEAWTTQEFFLSPRDRMAGYHSAEQVVTMGMRGAVHLLISQYGLEVVSHQDVDDMFAIEPRTVGITVTSHEHAFTTRSVFEASAAANELLHLLLYRDPDVRVARPDGSALPPSELWSASIVQRLNAMLHSDYGPALALYKALVTDRSVMPLEAMLATLSVLCDIALNPPLPPVVIDRAERTLAWRNVYPPNRFVALCYAAEKVGHVGPDVTHAALEEYVSKIADAAGLTNPQLYEFPELRIPDFAASDACGAFDSMPSMAALSYHHYVTWMQKQFHVARKRYLPLFSMPGAVYLVRPREEVFGDAVFGSRHYWLRPPVILHPNGGITMQSKKTPHSCLVLWLLYSSAFHYALFDLMVSTGVPDMSVYGEVFHPPDGPGWKNIRGQFEAVLRCSVW
ncbi:MAG: hypothetical protein AMXMBFR58_31660 [Phycisphaerae bacterium]